MVIFTIPILSIHEHVNGMSFHFLVSLSFPSETESFYCRGPLPLIKFIPRYFIFLEGIVNGSVSKISSYVCLQVEGHESWGVTIPGY